jgi:hypothetical protein
MKTSENKNVAERHGCLVCAKTFAVLAVYAPDGKLVNCTVTSPGGQIVPDQNRPLVACQVHTAGEIEAAYQSWQSRLSREPDHEQEAA